ncbi:MAG: hypothetical protein IJT94_11415 [Oscillibacter sp.]|nr:hypothetical protein [Oscillibacter sp.]
MAEQGTLYFLTGAAGEKKNAAGHLLAERLRARRAGAALYLDDQILWPMFEIPLDTPESRRDLALEHELPLCRLMTGQGIDVVLCSVVMSGDARAWLAENLPRFVEIFVPSGAEGETAPAGGLSVRAEGETPEEVVRCLETLLFSEVMEA